MVGQAREECDHRGQEAEQAKDLAVDDPLGPDRLACRKGLARHEAIL